MADDFSDRINLVKPLIEKFERAADSVSHNVYRDRSRKAIDAIFETERESIKTAVSASVFNVLFNLNGIDLLGFYRKAFLNFSAETVSMRQNEVTENVLAGGLMDYLQSAFFMFSKTSVTRVLAPILTKAEVVNTTLQAYLVSDAGSFDAASAAVDAYCQLVADKINETRMTTSEIKKPSRAFYIKKLNLFFDTPQGAMLRVNILRRFYQELSPSLDNDPGFCLAPALLQRYHILLVGLSVQQSNFRTFLESQNLGAAEIECEYQDYFSHAQSMQEEAFTEISTYFSSQRDDDALMALKDWEDFLEMNMQTLHNQFLDDNPMLDHHGADTPQVVAMSLIDARSVTAEFSEPSSIDEPEAVGEMPELDPRVENFDADTDKYIVPYEKNYRFFPITKTENLVRSDTPFIVDEVCEGRLSY